MVSLCIASAGEPLNRAKALYRFIDLAYMLQGKSFGNMFSAMAILYGIVAPQASIVGYSPLPPTFNPFCI